MKTCDERCDLGDHSPECEAAMRKTLKASYFSKLYGSVQPLSATLGEEHGKRALRSFVDNFNKGDNIDSSNPAV